LKTERRYFQSSHLSSSLHKSAVMIIQVSMYKIFGKDTNKF
jgi:hypothetical protein